MTATRPAGSDLLPHLRRARDHIDRNYAAPLDLDRLAAVAGVSKYHFVRCFEASFGETPIRYVTRRRIERAQDLLRHANLTVTEICTSPFTVPVTSLGVAANAIVSATFVCAGSMKSNSSEVTLPPAGMVTAGLPENASARSVVASML